MFDVSFNILANVTYTIKINKKDSHKIQSHTLLSMYASLNILTNVTYTYFHLLTPLDMFTHTDLRSYLAYSSR